MARIVSRSRLVARRNMFSPVQQSFHCRTSLPCHRKSAHGNIARSNYSQSITSTVAFASAFYRINQRIDQSRRQLLRPNQSGHVPSNAQIGGPHQSNHAPQFRGHQAQVAFFDGWWSFKQPHLTIGKSLFRSRAMWRAEMFSGSFNSRSIAEPVRRATGNQPVATYCALKPQIGDHHNGRACVSVLCRINHS